MESFYSLLDAPPGSWLRHEDVLACLHQIMGQQPNHDAESLTAEYLRRDFLNLVFGNPDNHGRNGGILRTPEGLRLAPVYDFAPMRLDPEGIVRTTRWRSHESAGEVDWRALTRSLSVWGRPDALFTALRDMAVQLRDLPERLRALGMPPEALESSRLDLLSTHARLQRWELL